MLGLLQDFWESTGFSQLAQCNTELFGLRLPGELIMICIACVFLYLAIKKGFELYLLIPIAAYNLFSDRWKLPLPAGPPISLGGRWGVICNSAGGGAYGAYTAKSTGLMTSAFCLVETVGIEPMTS